jgi:hypothetical protein
MDIKMNMYKVCEKFNEHDHDRDREHDQWTMVMYMDLENEIKVQYETEVAAQLISSANRYCAN